MKVLYNRGDFTFLVKYESKTYFVSIGSNKKASEIDDITAQELLQSGFWDVFKGELDREKKEAILEQIKKQYGISYH